MPPHSIPSQPDSFGSIKSHIISIGSICALGVIVIGPLLPWYDWYVHYVDGSQNNEVLIKCWSNVDRFLRGIGIRDNTRWGNLPSELWGEIGKRLVNRIDIVTFRCVCKQWRSSLPSPTGRFPLVLPPPPSCGPKFRDIPYAISELNIYAFNLGVCGNPYLQVDESGVFGLDSYLSCLGDKAEFDKRIRKAPFCRLRTLESIWNDKADRDRDSHIGLANGMIPCSLLTFFAKVYYPCMAFDSRKIRNDRLSNNEFPKKVVMISSSDSDGVNPNYARMSDLSVVAHLGGEMKGRLALLRLRGSPESWVWDTQFCTRVFVNIATFRGKLCTLDHCGRVFVMDYDSLKLTQVCAPLSPPPFELQGKSLFEYCGDLYLVDFKFDPKVYHLHSVLRDVLFEAEDYERSLKSKKNRFLSYFVDLKPFKTRFDAEAYKLSLQLQMWLKVDRPIARPHFGVVAPFIL